MCLLPDAFRRCRCGRTFGDELQQLLGIHGFGHVQVDARISVSEGHRIAESARLRVLREHPEVLDVLVHIDPDDGSGADASAVRLPSRDALIEDIGVLLGDIPPPQRVVLHYLGGGVEVEIFLAGGAIVDLAQLRTAEAALAERAKQHPAIRRIALNITAAP